jgi:hypothetical protein
MAKPLTIIAAAITLSVMSCTKQDKDAEKQTVTVELQSTIAAGSSVGRFSVLNLSLGTDATQTVVWSSKPDTGLYIWASGNTARVQFVSKGTYQVTGTLGNKVGNSSFTVKDTAVTLPSSYKDLPFAANEELVLTAKKMGDTLNNSGIQIGGYTTQKYPCGSWPKFGNEKTGNKLVIYYSGLLEPLQPCNSGPAVAYTGGGGITSMAPGTTYQLEIHFKGQTYTGSITKSDTGKFFISWTYTSGVKISPLAL